MEDKAMLPTISKRTFSPFLSNLFEDDFFPVMANRTSSMPAVNIREDEKNFILEVIQYCDLHPMPACHRELATWMNEQERLAIAYRRCIP